MTTALLAAAAILAPLPSPAAARLALMLPTPAVTRRIGIRLPVRHAAAAAGACGAVVVVLAGLGPAVALSVGLAAGAAVRGAVRLRADRAIAADRSAMLAAVTTLAAELRAGQPPAAALDAAAAVATGAPAAVLAEAAATSRLAGNVPAVLRAPAGCAPGPAAAFTRLAAAWQLSATTGTPLAAAVDVAAHAIRAQRNHDRQLAALLAGPRATAALLAGLPLIGVALGAAVGADPIGILLHTAAGQFALLSGVLLELAGLAWTNRIVRAAGAPR